MAHALEQFGDGTTGFVSAREDAWHKLGTVTPDVMTAEEALSAARLGGWNVRKLSLTARELSEDGVTSHEVDRFYATARTNPVSGATDILGVVGETYHPVQNEENCEILNALVDESGAHFETAGSLYGGRQVFVTMKLPTTMELGTARDALDLYIAALNSHDGSTAFRLLITPVRIVCANTQAMAISAAKTSFSIRHTETAKGRIAEARRALGLTWKYLEEFQVQAERMMEAPLEFTEFRKIVDELWRPVNGADSARTIGNSVRRDAALDSLFKDAATQKGIRGTRWAGLQAIGEYIDHYAPAKDAYARAVRTVSGDSMRMKEQAARLLAV